MLLDWLTSEEWTAVRLSVLVASTAVAASLPVGLALAYLLARGRFYGKTLLDTLVHLPLILPPVVTGYLLLLSSGKRLQSVLSLPTALALSSRFGGRVRLSPVR